ncbi:hypothetical protein OG455_37920 [Kitasatospora sp. NBC_01287]|uniref:hypothetical protein n=1 Tax=Kitasatospora sp. NBC_01287 TaxID=2903573 RepID=UPI00225961B0|nr:hypothetical protein [Kitasatospora sp. NBC_01287]MCX4744704.1 hypothetical protein [Kitasatospora sp. NBC_01287]MCX4745420.1 hypothetical protein [Kitasatospora sp. NBC_01287]MCX4745856.1 hypothetical protein [Kitasatospora sp. NBC_01287]MCX4747052.1 hypothetical protein [Kitasatospora sp. NBC_01287]MCX4747319.1 hypothetical protein [Kitasatospora sp. NBC_01287]
MPSVIALLERREARAREELDAWQELLREAQEQVAVHQERLECARIGREEVLRALAEEAEAVMVQPLTAVTPTARALAPVTAPQVPPQPPHEAGDGVPEPAVPAVPSVLRTGYDPRPPAWQPGLGVEVLAGAYRQVFDVVAGAGAPVAVKALTVALGRDAERLKEIEKVRHRAYALQARGWLGRVPGGLFIPAPGPARGAGAGGTRASAGAGGPSAGRG